MRSMARGGTFTLKHQGFPGEYHGITHTEEPSGVDFYIKGNQPIRQMNIFHEFGHLLDNTSGTWDVFTSAVSVVKNPSWVSNGVINPDALLTLILINDPNYAYVQARQTYSGQGPSEQWADAFANYVAGNIDLADANGPGAALYGFMNDTLAAYIGIP